MAIADLACLCHRAIIDAQRNMLTVVDIISEITVTREGEKNGDPIIVPVDFVLVSQWTREDRDKPETLEIKIAFEGPQGKVGEPQAVVVDLAEQPIGRLLVNVPRLNFTQGTGIYHFILSARVDGRRWKEKARPSFLVRIVEGPSTS